MKRRPGGQYKFDDVHVKWIIRRNKRVGTYPEKIRDFYKWCGDTISVNTWKLIAAGNYKRSHDPKRSAIQEFVACEKFWAWCQKHASQIENKSILIQLPLLFINTGFQREAIGIGSAKAEPPPAPPNEGRFTLLRGCDRLAEREVAHQRARGRSWSYVRWLVFYHKGLPAPNQHVLEEMAKRAWWEGYSERQARYHKWTAWRMCKKMRELNIDTPGLTRWYTSCNPSWG